MHRPETKIEREIKILSNKPDPVSEMLCSPVFRTPEDEQNIHPIILSVINHRQNPLESTYDCLFGRLLDSEFD
jgi:hypothetical protein